MRSRANQKAELVLGLKAMHCCPQLHPHHDGVTGHIPDPHVPIADIDRLPAAEPRGKSRIKGGYFVVLLPSNLTLFGEEALSSDSREVSMSCGCERQVYEEENLAASRQ